MRQSDLPLQGPQASQTARTVLAVEFTVNGRSSTRFIKPGELAEVRLRLRRFKRFKALNARLVAAYVKLSRAENL